MNSSQGYRIFVSSVQKELAEERQSLKLFIENDPLLRRFFTVFLFEDLPASNRRADAVYLAEVDRCAIYLGLFGNDYGVKDATGVSPTEQEFNRATIQGKARLIFIKGTNDKKRHPKMYALIHKAGSQLIRRRFNSIAELTTEIYASLVEHLETSGVIQSRPFDERLCMDATLDSLDAQAVKKFVRLARTGRQFPLSEEAPLGEVLTHLHLLHNGQLTNAALLLFGRDPQGFLPAAEIRCMHFHGMEIARPVPFYRIFKGTVFAQVDMAVDFVMSKLNRSVGTRAESSQAPVRYEIPPDVIHEAIVNAVAHRDYTSAGAVQVSVFADRVEIWNPGVLPAPLTPESLRHPHGSIARNHRICEAFFLAQYIEKYGTGTLMMIRECLAHQLPEPAFVQRGGEFTMTLWRDWLTEELLVSYGLNDRQMKAMAAIRKKSSISTMDYQALTGAARSTAKRDLEDLVGRGVLLLSGSGRGAFYELSKKRPINGPNGPSGTQGLNLDAPVRGSQRAHILQVRKQDINRTNETFFQGPIAPGSESVSIVEADKTSRNELNKKEIKLKSQRIADRKPRRNQVGAGRVTGEVTGEVGAKSGLSRHQVIEHDTRQAPDKLPTSPRQVAQQEAAMLETAGNPVTRTELQQSTGLKDREHFVNTFLKPMLEAGLLEMTIPEKPRSSLQKYRTTEKGRTWLVERKP